MQMPLIFQSIQFQLYSGCIMAVCPITCHIGAFCFDARQFGAFHFGDFHFDAVPVRRVSLWRASTSARFSLARFHFGAFLFGAFPNFVSKLMHNRLFDNLFPFCACFLRRSVVYASFARSHSTRLTFAYHFLCVFTLCVIYLLIISTRQRWLHNERDNQGDVSRSPDA